MSGGPPPVTCRVVGIGRPEKTLVLAPAKVRYVTLNKVAPESADWFLNLNGVHFSDAPPTEAAQVGTVDDWSTSTWTGDTHPMHTHLVSFQVVGRTPFDVEAYRNAYGGP